MKNTKTMKKTISILTGTAILAAALAAFTSCGGQDEKKPSDTPQNNTSIGESENVQIPNPWTEYDSLDAAVKGSGITITLPETVGGQTATFYQAINGEMIEVRYGEDNLIRKGTGNQDISGDYNAYGESVEQTIDGKTVTFKSNDEKVRLAIWSEGEYSYSVSMGDGVTAEEMTALVSSVK